MSLDNLKREKMSVTATLHRFSLTPAKICRIIHPCPLVHTLTVMSRHMKPHTCTCTHWLIVFSPHQVIVALTATQVHQSICRWGVLAVSWSSSTTKVDCWVLTWLWDRLLRALALTHSMCCSFHGRVHPLKHTKDSDEMWTTSISLLGYWSALLLINQEAETNKIHDRHTLTHHTLHKRHANTDACTYPDRVISL